MNAGQILAEVFYTLIGIVFILVGLKALKDPGAQKKGTTAAFWFLLAFTFICGNWIPKWLVGLAIVAMAVLTGIKGVVQSASDVPDPKVVRERADKFGYKIFIPALSLALSAVVLSTLGSKVPALSWITANNSICLAGLIALCVVLAMTKADPKYAVVDGTRLMDNVGPTGILPQLLSALGSLFTAAGVGTVIANGVAAVVPEGNKFIACLVYCVAMALFTIIMGNGFAAFSVITVGIGIPFLIMQGANPIVVGALGLTAGYCGTLCTPMAANFNIMPAALLEVKNKYAIIKSQVPVALCMLAIHVVLMYLFAF
ncbi:MAG: DUF979 domain-containing protein [Oscillospiraceae bacterium]|nr:DUF979 domain-containing protein [Oscillospiraceae bacterium]MDO5138368.1 DUF979 domain-containing protein [Oscillospiraceae bacterium]